MLQLFGEARGWVPKRYISAEGPVDYPEKLFFIGQSLKCKVMDVDEDVSKMTLSLIIGGTSKPLGSKEKKAGQRLELGSAYTCKVADVSEDGLAVEVDLEDGSEVVKCHVPKVCSLMHFFSCVLFNDPSLGRNFFSFVTFGPLNGFLTRC